MKTRLLFSVFWLVLLVLAAGGARATTLTVTSSSNGSNDGSGCTLRDAIQSVNLRAPVGQCAAAAGPIDTINLPFSPLEFTQADAHSTNAALPSLKASRYLNLYGTGNSRPTIAREHALACNADNSTSAGEFRLLEVEVGAALYVDNVLFRDGCADGPADLALDYSSPNARAGAILNYGTLYLSRSVFLLNEANGVGGAIFNGADATLGIATTTFLENRAHIGGGALFVAAPTGEFAAADIATSVFQGNVAYAGSATTLGGAIRNAGTLSVANTTFYGNSATSAGAIHDSGYAAVSFATFLNNEGAAHDLQVAGNAAVEVKSSIFATAPFSGIANCIVADTANVAWYGRSISADASCGGGANLTGTGAGVAVLLADNGGPTQTLRLAAGSPAVAAAADCSDVYGNALGTDQRGSPRPPQNCDAGAYDSDRLFASAFQ